MNSISENIELPVEKLNGKVLLSDGSDCEVNFVEIIHDCIPRYVDLKFRFVPHVIDTKHYIVLEVRNVTDCSYVS